MILFHIRQRVPRTRNAGAWTESRYWSQVRSALRNGFRYWKPMMLAKEAAKRPKKNGGVQKWEYKCAACKKWHKHKNIQIDHIKPVGSLRGPEDLAPFLENLTPENGFQVLCKECHRKKTNKEREAAKNERQKSQASKKAV